MPAGASAKAGWTYAGVVGLALFALAAAAFFLRSGFLDAADASLAGAGGQAGFLAASALAFLGNIEFVGVALILSCTLLARSGRPAAAVALIGIFLLEESAVQALKQVVARPRPEWAATAAAGWSFPSGHAARGALMATMVVALAPRTRTRLALGLAVAFGLLMGAARVVLGVHHVSDVLAGAGLGLAAAALGTAALLGYEERRATVRVPVAAPPVPEAPTPLSPPTEPRA